MIINDKKISLRLPEELASQMMKIIKGVQDPSGLRSISINTWIIFAIREKIEREQRTQK